jgi:MOSC domain-containing protein YiiM
VRPDVAPRAVVFEWGCSPVVSRDTIGQVVSVNVGVPREVHWHGRDVISAIWKQPVEGRRRLAGVNVDGDAQADRRVHGGPTKAVYAYALADYRWWEAQGAGSFEPGTFGENLTIEGIDPAAAVVGERWRAGTAIVRVTEPRIPCYKLGLRMGDAGFVDRFADAARPGTYLGIDVDGDVGAGDAIELLQRPNHGLTVGTVERAYHGHSALLDELADVADLSDSWRDWARHARARAQRRPSR